MLRTVSWTIRGVAFALIGLDTFVRSTGLPTGPGRTAIAAGYLFCGGCLALWAVLDLRAPVGAPAGGPAVPLLLGAVSAVAGAACAQPGAGTTVGLAAIAVIAAGSDLPLSAGWTVAALGVLAVQAGALASGAGRGVFLGYPLLLVVALLAGHNRRAHRLRAEQAALLLDRSEELRAEQRRTAVLDERARIAREIHDVLAHSLGALGIQIQLARALAAQDGGPPPDPRLLETLDRARRMASDGLVETRRAVHALRGGDVPLPEGLEAAAAEHRLRHAASVRLEVHGARGPALGPEQNLHLLRTAQEALVNAAKHAPGRPVSVTLDYRERHVSLTVSNPLCPPGPGRVEAGVATVDGGYGLTGIRERLALLGGTLRADGADGIWTLTARVPR
ncbi:sensor histidine kinase [Kitasatospora sp. NPDC088783]|uniref:sensor histidine kinase n=1 Tax=Kitasatospora sp. NPDC088783 TaxID=3364077 RepID=UPI0038276111